jgi:hypothetical protein
MDELRIDVHAHAKKLLPESLKLIGENLPDGEVETVFETHVEFLWRFLGRQGQFGPFKGHLEFGSDGWGITEGGR